jgi:2-polyprenyl-3-methyl-5-hydroxy-6-metoxy-1,4-benzoquinol methylase
MGFHYSEDYHKAIVTAAEHNDGGRWQAHRALIARYKQGGAILDIGCSSGSFLAGMNNGLWKLYGIEMDSATAERAKLTSGAEVFVGDIMGAPFSASSFDVITAFDVLEHVYHPREFLERVLHWLRPGGIFFARLPNIDSWEARLFGTYWYGLELPRHLYHFSPRSMRCLVAEVGACESQINATGKGSHAHHSTRYVYEAILQRLGFSPIPMAKARRANLAWRAVRKALWLTLVAPLSWIASAAGAGVVIDVILKKEATETSGTAGSAK